MRERGLWIAPLEAGVPECLREEPGDQDCWGRVKETVLGDKVRGQ